MNDDRALRERLVHGLQRAGTLHDRAVANALLSVPRHRFVPDYPLEAAYEDRALAIKERDGVTLSSISQPGMIAHMLEFLEVREGQRILEIGTGSGYNAALLATLAGSRGRVVTVDLEADLATSARERLRELGFANVEVHVGDARALRVEGRFDRAIVTARADDIEPAWWSALAPDARLVVPLDLNYGGERVVAFSRYGERLYAKRTQACTFIGMRSEADERGADIFFRSPGARNAPEPDARHPIEITAMRRDDVKPEFLENADVVIARPHTLFAVTFLW